MNKIQSPLPATAYEPDYGFDPKGRDSYSWIYREKIRYNDLDPLGHVTSQSFVNFFETARVLFILEAGQRVDDPEFGLMLVRLDTSFHGQLHFPAEIDVGTRLIRLGNSSLTTMQGIFYDGTCRANLLSVLVHVDRKRDRSAAIPDDFRRRLLAVDGQVQAHGDS